MRIHPEEKSTMTNKIVAIAAAAGLLTALSAGAMAQNAMAPGQQMKQNGSVTGHPGASGYAPGIQMQEKGSVKGTTGASGYAPGRHTTGASVNSDTKLKAGGLKAKSGINAGGNVKTR
jgi:hypothetical protein